MLILRDLFGSWICGTEEHYLRLCQGEDPHRRQRNVIHIHAKIQVLIQFIHAYEYIWINLGIDSNNGYLSKYRYWLNLCIFRKEFGYWIKLRLRNTKKSSNLQKSFRIYHLSVKQNVSFIQLPFYHLTMGRASWPLTRLILRIIRDNFEKSTTFIVFYFFNFLSQPISTSTLVGSDKVIGWPKPLPLTLTGNQGSWFLVSKLIFSK